MKWWTNGGLTFSLIKTTFGYGLDPFLYPIQRESISDIRPYARRKAGRC
jgi:hypothetical protein